MKLIALAAALLSVTGVAVAQDTKAGPKNVAAPSTARVIQMQTAFNPALPGSGEGVRVFTRSLKQMTAGAVAIKILEPGRVAPTADMLDAIVAGDLEAAFTWSGYAATKAPVFNIFATVPFGLGPEEMASWMLEGDGSRIHHDAYDKLGVAGIPCGMQGSKGGGWFRSEVNSVGDFKGLRLRYGKLAAEVIARLGAVVVPLPPGEFFYKLQQGNVDGGEMSTPAMDAALGFDKLGLPYYLPGWQQPSAVLDFLMRKDKWAALPASLRGADPDRLSGEHRLDARPLAQRAGRGAGEAEGVRRRGPRMVARRSGCLPQEQRDRGQGSGRARRRLRGGAGESKGFHRPGSAVARPLSPAVTGGLHAVPGPGSFALA